MDRDRDGKITPEEFELVGLDRLPDFKDLGAEGHHYDIESGECNESVSLPILTYGYRNRILLAS